MGCGISSKNIPLEQPKLRVPSKSILGFEMDTKRKPSAKKIQTCRVQRFKTPPVSFRPSDSIKRMSTKHTNASPIKKSANYETTEVLTIPDSCVETQSSGSNQFNMHLLSLDFSNKSKGQTSLKKGLTRSTFNGSNDSKCYIKVTEATTFNLDKSETPSFEECKYESYVYTENNINIYSS